MIRLLICGGRDFTDRRMFRDSMRAFSDRNEIACIIHGVCKTGADAMAEEWLTKYGIEPMRFPADWMRLGKKAGPIRNQRMIDEGKPHVVIAFPGGAGTRGMVKLTEKAGVLVLEPPFRWGE